MSEQSLDERGAASRGRMSRGRAAHAASAARPTGEIPARKRLSDVGLGARDGEVMSRDAGSARLHEAAAARYVPAASRTGPLRHLIRDELLRGILSGRYAPGQRLLEMRIAAEFETSQGPVREAFRELEATGLVVNVPRRGTYVAENTAASLREIYAVRGSLEEAATRLATRRRRGEVADLVVHVEAMRAAAIAGDSERLGEESVAFHRAILVSAGNQLLLSIWSSLHIETRTTITMLTRGLDLAAVAESHQPIVDAMASGDAEEAARRARVHQDYFEALPVPFADAGDASQAPVGE